MPSTPDQVECEVCGEMFDPNQAGGMCTNPDCGEWQYEADDGSGGSAEGGDDMIECKSCGETVPNKDFCIQCGENFEDGDEGQSEPADPTCPSCDADIEPDWAACPQCGEDLSSPDESETDEPPEDPDPPDTDGPGETEPIDPTPDEVVVEVGDVDIRADDGETIGKKVRSAYVRTGADEDQAQYIHREHVKFELEDGSFYLVNKGRNGTKLNGEELDMDERREITSGDTVEFSNRAEGNIRLE